MNIRRATQIASAGAVVVGVIAVWLSQPEIAATALGVAMLGILSLLVLLGRVVTDGRSAAQSSTRGLRKQVRQNRRKLVALSKSLTRVDRRLDGHAAQILAQIATTRERVLTTSRDDVNRLFAEQQKTPGLTVELARAYDQWVDQPRRMPQLGGWALSASTLLWLLDHLGRSGARTVLECGSGTSTVWIATALERRGGDGSVVALESSEEYAAVTRAEIERLGLSHRATIIHAPLVETTAGSRPTQPWFDLSGLSLGDPVDLLFVDGPVGGDVPLARYPAFPLLAEHLAPGATVLLDDTNRPAETEIVKIWTQETHHGRRLTKTDVVDRTTVLTVATD